MTLGRCPLSRPHLGVKRTSVCAVRMSPLDPKGTSHSGVCASLNLMATSPLDQIWHVGQTTNMVSNSYL